jgi:hypothetical protein
VTPGIGERPQSPSAFTEANPNSKGSSGSVPCDIRNSPRADHSYILLARIKRRSNSRLGQEQTLTFEATSEGGVRSRWTLAELRRKKASNRVSRLTCVGGGSSRKKIFAARGAGPIGCGAPFRGVTGVRYIALTAWVASAVCT